MLQWMAGSTTLDSLRARLECSLADLRETDARLELGKAHRKLGAHHLPDSGLSRIVEQLYLEHKPSAIIIYGSVAAGTSDAQSDLDVLLIHKDPNQVVTYCDAQIDGQDVDVSLAGHAEIARRLHAPDRLNNNWMLNIFTSCKLLVDHDGQGERLRRIAEDIQRRGPRSLKRDELLAAESGLYRQLRTAERMHLRSIDDEDQVLVRFRCDQLVMHAFYAFHCARGKWTMAFHKLVERVKTTEPELFTLWSTYRHANDNSARLVLARRFIEVAFSQSFN